MSEFWIGWLLGIATIAVPLVLLVAWSALRASRNAEQALDEMVKRSQQIMPPPMQQSKKPPRSMWSN